MSDTTKKSLREVMKALSAPFNVDLVYWKPQATTKDKKRGLAAAYADNRAYEDRLNAVVPEDWSTTAAFEVAGGKLVCTVHLTILGVTRAGDGEADLDDSNAATSAYAQAFKRAASRFGLGRYLYDLPSVWEELEGKVFSEAALKRLRALYLNSIGAEPEKDKAKPKSEPKSGAKKAEAGPSLEEALKVTIHFGPHKGKALSRLLELGQEGRDYLGWLAGEVRLPSGCYSPVDSKGKALQAAAKVVYTSLKDEEEAKAEPEPRGEGDEAELTLEAAQTVVIGMGKHKGKTLGEIAEADPGYLAWLAGAKDDPKKRYNPRNAEGKALVAAAKVVYASLQEAAEEPEAKKAEAKAMEAAEAEEPRANASGNGKDPELEAALAVTVPFGTYKDQPLRALAEDGRDGARYLGWLAGQVKFNGKPFEPKYRRGRELAAAAKVVWASLPEEVREAALAPKEAAA